MDWLSPIGTTWNKECSQSPCLTGGLAPHGEFIPQKDEQYLIGPKGEEIEVTLVCLNISGSSPFLGVIELPNMITSDVWRKDGTHRSLNPMLTLRNK